MSWYTKAQLEPGEDYIRCVTCKQPLTPRESMMGEECRKCRQERERQQQLARMTPEERIEHDNYQWKSSFSSKLRELCGENYQLVDAAYKRFSKHIDHALQTGKDPLVAAQDIFNKVSKMGLK